MRTTHRRLYLGAMLLLCAGALPHGDAQTVLRPVDQGVADRTALSDSRRDMGVDLRAPSRFEQLYRLDARSRLLSGVRGWRGGAYARAQGGLVAVFPQSAYRTLPSGATQVQVPAGTVFTLGDARTMQQTPAPAPTSPSRSLLRRIETPAPDDPPLRIVPDAERIHASIWVSEEYRSRRVAALIEKAWGSARE